jgi:cellulose synthase/poly-beta-1,6-N-acetylglucosamine synthase-like glycosyltransferase
MNHFIHNHDASTWLVQGFSEVIPLGEETYFRATASKYGTKFDEELSIEPSSTKTRVVSVCIPCFNEEASALERTLKSLRAQKIPPGHVLEILIVMDGVQKMSKSMHTYLHTLFGLRQDTETDNPFHQLPDAETIVVESIDSNTVHDNHGRGDGVSLILKRNNQRKVNSQMWWLGGHARDSGCEFALATDCGIIFEQTSIARMLCRLDQDQTLAAVTGFQRVMTASMQGDGPNELLTDPMGYALRQIQRFDFEVR